MTMPFASAVLNPPPVVRLVLVVEVSDPRDVRVRRQKSRSKLDAARYQSRKRLRKAHIGDEFLFLRPNMRFEGGRAKELADASSCAPSLHSPRRRAADDEQDEDGARDQADLLFVDPDLVLEVLGEAKHRLVAQFTT